MSEEGTIVGLGHVFPDASEGDADTAEIAVIVEDAYQGRGIGTRLLRHMLGWPSGSASPTWWAPCSPRTPGCSGVEATGLDWTREPTRAC